MSTFFLFLGVASAPILWASSADESLTPLPDSIAGLVAAAQRTQVHIYTGSEDEKYSVEVRWNDIENLGSEKAQEWLGKEAVFPAYPRSLYVPLLLPVYPYSALDSITFSPGAVSVYQHWGENYEDMRQSLPLASLSPSYGFVTLPEGDDPCPGVVLCHGSEGLNPFNYLGYADLLAKNGIASILASSDAGHFVLQKKENGETEYVPAPSATADAQLGIPLEQQIIGITRIAEIFSTHPRLVGQKMGIMGWSRGGTVALETCMERVRSYLKPKISFSACALYYPFPIQHRADMSSVPIHVLHGEEDTYTPLDVVQAYFKNVKADVSWSLYPGVGHAFDGVDGKGYLEDAQNFSQAWACFSDGESHFVGSDGKGYPIEMYAPYLMSNITLGAHLSGNPEVKEKANENMIRFFKNHLWA